MIKLLSLFGGIGADIKALKNLGHTVKTIDYVEIMENRVKAYNAMNPFRYKTQDIRGWDLKPHILVHGSPCQQNSVANLICKNSSLEQSKLLLETTRIIREMGEWRPEVVIWENVKGVLYKDKLPIFKQYLREMESYGYTNSFEVVQALDFGVPQSRERIFCISMLNGKAFDFSRLRKRPRAKLEDFLQDESEIDLEKYIVKAPSMLNRLAELASPEEIAANKEKFNYIPTVTDYMYTLTTRPDRCPGPGVIKTSDGRFRYPTELEAWRLMGFDSLDFKLMEKEFPIRKHQRSATLYQLAGNSIVVNVLEEIFQVLLSDYIQIEFEESKQLKLI